MKDAGATICIEPIPVPWPEAFEINLHHKHAQSFQRDFSTRSIRTGNVLFIDSTHTVKAGSDCLHLYLRILPEITVHAHRI